MHTALPIKLANALADFSTTHPHLGGILRQARIDVDIVGNRTETMSVFIEGFMLVLLVNAHFVDSLTMPELMGVLMHEARHVIYGHLLMRSDAFPDANALIIAMEVTVNEHMPYPLPGKPITLESIGGLPADESTRERYARLTAQESESQANKPDLAKEAQSGAAMHGDGKNDGPDEVSIADGNKSDESQNNSPGKNSLPDTGFDDHTHPPSHDIETVRHILGIVAAKVVDELAELGDAGRGPQSQEAKDIELLKLLEQQCGSDFGLTPGGIMTNLPQGMISKPISWQSRLRHLVGSARRSVWSCRWPNRRQPERLGVIPGRRRRAHRPKLMLAIDTSGSMSDMDLANIFAAVRPLAQDWDVVLVQFDAIIQDVRPFSGTCTQVFGRGGTDFRPVLASSFLVKHAADAVIIATDGHGPYPDRPPVVPVFWLLTPTATRKLPWGSIIRMDVNRQKRTKNK